MFCPNCGIEETSVNQFCRACGTDLRSVRFAVESPDSITASAASARDEIGRAVAFKIRETQSVKELKKVVEEVLPEIEKFLESPEEKRLRRVRVGTLISSIGLGAATRSVPGRACRVVRRAGPVAACHRPAFSEPARAGQRRRRQRRLVPVDQTARPHRRRLTAGRRRVRPRSTPTGRISASWWAACRGRAGAT